MTNETAIRPRLWGTRPTVVVIGGNLVAVVIVAASWWTVSGARSIPHQAAWLNLGLAGILVAGAANAVWLGTGRRAVRAARSSTLPAPPRPVSEAAPPASVPSVPVSDVELVRGTSMTRYHRPGCVMVRGKQVSAASRPDHEQARAVACEVCQP